MDKLLNYIEFRAQKYGVIKGIASVSSMYYQIGQYRVRISDHLKFSEDSAKDCDFFFNIQPNDIYIFHTSPKHMKDNKVYPKIITYQEAKEYIKFLDETAIQWEKMTSKPFIPENWNRDVKEPERLSWKEFEKQYLDGKDNDYKLGIINRIESLVFGSIKKGNCETKYPTLEETYTNMTNSQYNALIVKMETK